MKYPVQEPDIRLGRVRELMQKDGVDVLVIYSPQWKVEFIHYAANFRVLGTNAVMVLPLSGEPTLYLNQPWDLPRATAESWVKDIVVAPEHMLKLAGEKAAKSGSVVGVAGLEIMAGAYYAELDAALQGKKIVNAYDLMEKAAIIKSAWEQEILRKCGKLADAGFTAELDCLRVGISEYEVVAEIEHAMRLGGADDDFQMIGMGTNLPSMNLASENTLKMGDLVETEITPMIGSITYATQLCKTVKMGPASDVEHEKFKLLVDALNYALSKMKAGVPAKNACIWQNEIIGGAGYEEYCHPPYMRSRGHNFGMGTIEISETTDLILEPGMTMVVHPNQYIPEVGYLVLGETIIITDTGIERLSSIPAKLFEILPRI
ncbi:Xaa-Pro peptidase family protein [Lachnospiraceae bacterium ZAX-1]